MKSTKKRKIRVGDRVLHKFGYRGTVIEGPHPWCGYECVGVMLDEEFHRGEVNQYATYMFTWYGDSDEEIW